MITLTILVVIWFVYSVYKIKQTCGLWKDFEPCMVPYFPHLGFYFGMVFIIYMLLVVLVYGIVAGIIP
jgi:hypothetical protein